MEDLMDAMLQWQLMGRIGVSSATPGYTATPFVERILVYAAKFPLSDIYILLAALLCRSVA